MVSGTAVGAGKSGVLEDAQILVKPCARNVSLQDLAVDLECEILSQDRTVTFEQCNPVLRRLFIYMCQATLTRLRSRERDCRCEARKKTN
jgi:hypothetical protein